MNQQEHESKNLYSPVMPFYQHVQSLSTCIMLSIFFDEKSPTLGF